VAVKRKVRPAVYGLMAEFDNPTAAVAAARSVYEQGYRKIDAFSPYPVEELSEAVGVHQTYMSHLVLAGGLIGGTLGYLMQFYLHTIYYPLNVGGKPFHSWPAFIPVTFECTVLGAALFAVFGMFALNGLPEPYHPVFNTPNFALATRDRFFLVIEAKDPKFKYEETRRFMETLNAREVTDVES
jgi:hypothetical protein